MLSVVWFKRDLRVRDHAPLLEASQRGALIALYIYEPELLHSPEFDPSHLEFINASLTELSADLERLGGRLVTRVGEASAVLGRSRGRVARVRATRHSARLCAAPRVETALGRLDALARRADTNAPRDC